jgi:rubrerythrin
MAVPLNGNQPSKHMKKRVFFKEIAAPFFSNAFLLRQTDELPETDDGELEALRAAIDFEVKGIAFYTQLGDLVADPKEKAFFNLLAQMEQEHFLALKKTKDYLANPKAWLKNL